MVDYKKPSQWSAATIAAIKQRFLNGGSLSGFKYYTAHLSQSGTSAPVETILKDTISGMTWSRSSAGVYLLSKYNTFLADKTVPKIDTYIDVDGNKFVLERVDANTMRLTTYLAIDTETPADDVLSDQYVHIEVYS